VSFPFRISTAKEEGILQVSKWLKCQVLLDVEEMTQLLAELDPIHFCVVSEPVMGENALFSVETFLSHYRIYIEALQQGHLIDEAPLRRFFSSAMTRSTDLLFAIAAGDKNIIKPLKPIIQLQAHHFFYSTFDRKFHPMVMSQECITWGIQFSYPQLYQDPRTALIEKVSDGDEFPNSPVFQHLMRWMRQHTMPTPFVVEGTLTHSTIRIGKACLKWIHRHSQLMQKGISVHAH